ALCLAGVAILSIRAGAQESRVTLKSTAPFGTVAEALERAVTDEKMRLVCHANAQRAAAGRGGTVKRNQVPMVFPNDFAGRLWPRTPPRVSRLRSASTSMKMPTGPRRSRISRRAWSSRRIGAGRFRLSRESWMESSRRSLTAALPHDDQRGFRD